MGYYLNYTLYKQDSIKYEKGRITLAVNDCDLFGEGNINNLSEAINPKNTTDHDGFAGNVDY